MNADGSVREYLERLEAAAWPLPAGRRAELAGEVSEHIETALAEAGQRDEVTVRNTLERLGPPEDIVAAETEAGGMTGQRGTVTAVASTQAGSRWGAIEVIALLLLTVGALVLPIVGPLVGLVFAWASNQWTRRQKLVATAIVAVYVAVIVLGLVASGQGTEVMSGPETLP